MEEPEALHALAIHTSNWSLRRRLKDYALVGKRLLMQRMLIFLCAAVLAGAYYGWQVSAAFWVAIMLGEIYDYRLFKRVLRNSKSDRLNIACTMRGVLAGTVFSACAISAFCIAVAIKQGPGDSHFLPLFLLISASIFAAMNNHHFLRVLYLRLTIYLLAILFIPIYDLWVTRPPLGSALWLNFFSVVFVIGFIVEMARSFLGGYSAYLTSRRSLEVEHRRALDASEAKTRFLATVSHELRTPLTSITGALDLVNSGKFGAVPPSLERLLEVAARNAKRLGDLVGDLLLLQASESNKLSFDVKRVDMTDAVRNAADCFEPYAERHKVTLATHLPDAPLTASGDRKRLEQVVTNLLSNAAKFSHEGGQIDLTLTRKLGNIAITVADRGIGISEGRQAEVFEEFVQLDQSDQRKYEGTGLGLSICKRIIEGHGGHIYFESEPGVGTTFTVTLPAV